MNRIGFKKLSAENWLEPESVMSAFVTLSLKDSTKSPISADAWLDRFLKPQLDSTVPFEIHRLFEVARGAAAYGYLFYPLYTLAGEQLYRVAEAAASAKCKLLRAKTRKVKSFQNKISFLHEQNVILQQDWIWWDSIRHLRNFASHPGRQVIMMPHDALYNVASVANHVNDLFVERAA
jgi:Domain of unknown function (DUF4145)